jgi:hypothetical protein
VVTGLNLKLFDSYPYHSLEPDLQALVLGARRADAAVAFVTRPGVAFSRQYVKTHPSARPGLSPASPFRQTFQS